MGRVRTAVKVGAGMTAAISIAGAAFGGYVYHENRMPGFILTALEPDEMPEPLPEIHARETLICPEDAKECTRAAAIGYTATKGHVTVRLKDLDQYTKDAIIAAEDRRFYEHNGVDMRGLARAMKNNGSNLVSQCLMRRDCDGIFAEGGSTIDRQVADLVYPDPTVEQLQNNHDAIVRWWATKKDYLPQDAYPKQLEVARKLLYEAQVALRLNQQESKDQIFEIYINNAPFGRGSIGLEDAAQTHFNKPAKDLTPEEAIFLAGQISSPSNMDLNIANPKTPAEVAAMKAERDRLSFEMTRVLRTMIEDGKFSLTEAAKVAEAARTLTPVPFTPRKNTYSDYSKADKIGAQHALDLIMAQAQRLTGKDRTELRTGGYKIYTTLDTRAQKAMYDTIHGNKRIMNDKKLDAAGIALRKDGTVMAMVGSKDYGKRQINMAIGSLGGGSGRDAGSSLKGFGLATALAHGWNINKEVTVNSTLPIHDPKTGQDWLMKTGAHCDELGRPLPCTMTLTEGLAVSSNMVAGEFVNAFGTNEIVGTMQSLGMRTPKQYGPSIILGTGEWSPLDIATGYNNLLLRDGQTARYTEPIAVIRKIVDVNGNTVYQLGAPSVTEAVDKKVSDQAAEALNAVTRYGTAEGAIDSPNGPKSVAGKTGTADSHTDLWFTGSKCDGKDGGFTASLWVGDPSSKREIQGFTSRDTAKLFGQFVLKAPHSDKKCDLRK